MTTVILSALGHVAWAQHAMYCECCITTKWSGYISHGTSLEHCSENSGCLRFIVNLFKGGWGRGREKGELEGDIPELKLK